MNRITLAFLLSLAFAGCSDPPSTSDFGNGELGEGNFVYSCASAADAFCADGVAGPLPTSVALGASFGVHFDGVPGTPASTLDADTDFFATTADGVFDAKRIGYGAILARAADGDVVDFLNLRVHEIASLAIRGVDATSTFSVGDTISIRGEPLDADGVALAGTLAYDWDSSDASVVTVTVSDDDRAQGGATLHAIGRGAARIRVVSGATTATIDLQVGGA